MRFAEVMNRDPLPSEVTGARPTWRIAAILLALCVTIAGCESPPAEAPPPPSVTVAYPMEQSVTDYLEFTGNTAATDSVTLVARVEGFLDSIHFTDGSTVHKGDLLFTIQQEQYKAQLQQARAQVAAQTAALWHARQEFARYSKLLAEDAATQTDVDHWHYERDSAEAGLLGAQAQVELAKLNLSYTTVTAPFDGRIGRHLVNPGNVVGAMGQQTALAQIDQIDPLYVYFTINERDLLKILSQQKTRPTEPLYKRAIPAFFSLSNEKNFPHEGRLDFASISVSPTTGTLQLRGIFPNHMLTILPGLFVRIRVPIEEERKALTVPGDALSFDQQGEYLLVVNNQNVVERRSVKAGAQVGERLVIEEGVTDKDKVIVEGLLQSIPGRTVAPQMASAAVAAHPPAVISK